MYHSRLVEKEIELKLRTSGAVVVAGPKFCGKTTTCMLFQKSFVKLNTKQSIAMARMNPKAVLQGEKPRLIDEWQKAPDIWNQVKDELDFNYEFGKYILTGSSTPADKTEVHHSGAGRITPVKMRPMSLWESKYPFQDFNPLNSNKALRRYLNSLQSTWSYAGRFNA